MRVRARCRRCSAPYDGRDDLEEHESLEGLCPSCKDHAVLCGCKEEDHAAQ